MVLTKQGIKLLISTNMDTMFCKHWHYCLWRVFWITLKYTCDINRLFDPAYICHCCEWIYHICFKLGIVLGQVDVLHAIRMAHQFVGDIIYTSAFRNPMALDAALDPGPSGKQKSYNSLDVQLPVLTVQSIRCLPDIHWCKMLFKAKIYKYQYVNIVIVALIMILSNDFVIVQTPYINTRIQRCFLHYKLFVTGYHRLLWIAKAKVQWHGIWCSVLG